MSEFERSLVNTLNTAFREANKRIGKWNKEHMPSPDYVTNDLAGCVASGATLNKNLVYLGFICDCGVAIFDEKGELRFRTESEGPGKYHEYIWQDKRLEEKEWRNPEARKK